MLDRYDRHLSASRPAWYGKYQSSNGLGCTVYVTHRLAFHWRLFFTGLLHPTMHIARVVAKKSTINYSHLSARKIKQTISLSTELYLE